MTRGQTPSQPQEGRPGQPAASLGPCRRHRGTAGVKTNFRTSRRCGTEGLGPCSCPPSWGWHSPPTNRLQPAWGPAPRPRCPRLPAGRGGWRRQPSCRARRAGPLGEEQHSERPRQGGHTAAHGLSGPGDRLATALSAGRPHLLLGRVGGNWHPNSCPQEVETRQPGRGPPGAPGHPSSRRLC